MMPLKMMLFTTNTSIAELADKCGVDRIVVDLEVLGKKERQGHLDTRISRHSVQDVANIRHVIHQSELLVRINPMHDESQQEIESVIAAGADIIMLPYFKTLPEVKSFLNLVQNRVKTCLLLETAEAEAILGEILAFGGFDMIHVGINDLAISKGMKFLFHPLLEPSFENLCASLRKSGIPYGFGGITRLYEGKVPSQYVIPEHYRLGSCQIILGRSFLSSDEIENDLEKAKSTLVQAVQAVRDFEASLAHWTDEQFQENASTLRKLIREVVYPNDRI